MTSTSMIKNATDLKNRIAEIRKFNRFYTDLIGLLNNHLLDSDYSIAEARILFEIFTRGNIAATDIVGKLSLDKGYLSRILKKMSRDGLILKSPSETDARVVFISLTQKGLSVFNELNEASDLQISQLISPVSVEDIEKLIFFMNGIREILEKPVNLNETRSGQG